MTHTTTDSPADRSVTERSTRSRLSLEAGLVALLIAASYALLLPPTRAPGSAGDDGVYLALGKALATGQGYRSIYTVGAPVHVKFPPGMPSIYAIFWRLTGNLDGVIFSARLLNCVATGAAAGLLWWYARRRLRLGALVTAALALGPLFLDSTLQYAGLALSEPCFMLSWAAALVLAAEYRGRPSAAAAARAVFLGLLLAMAALIRTQAVVLVAGFPAALAIKRAGWRNVAVCAAAALVPLLVWYIWHALMAAPSPAAGVETGYVADLGPLGWSQIAALFAGIPGRLRIYPSIFAPFLSPVLQGGGILIGFYLALALFGLVRLARPAPELVMGVVGTMLLIVLWPYTIDRFILSLLPFLGLAAAYRVELELPRVLRVGRLVAAGAAVILVAALALRQITIRRMAAQAAQEDRPAAFWTPSYTIPAVSAYLTQASTWIQRNTPPTEHVVAAWPEGLFLRTGRQTENLEPAESSLRPSVHRVPGRYLAQAIVAGTAGLVIAWDSQSVSVHDIAAVRRACPGVLVPVGHSGPHGFPEYFRVNEGGSCLRVLAAAPEAPRASGGRRVITLP